MRNDNDEDEELVNENNENNNSSSKVNVGPPLGSREKVHPVDYKNPLDSDRE